MKKETDKKVQEIYCETKAKQRLIQVRLDQIKVLDDLYCHRSGNYKDPVKNKDFALFVAQIKRDGRIQVPIEVVKSGRGWVLIRGHRRVAACFYLAGQNQPGFSEEMALDAVEVYDADEQDLLIRSVSDNENRLSLTREQRIIAARRLAEVGVPFPRAANALGVSEQTFKRDYLIATHPWMFEHFRKHHIEATVAAKLLETAIEADKAQPLPEGNRVDSLRADLGLWVRKQEIELEEIKVQREILKKKKLSEKELYIKKRMPSHLVEHWLRLVEAGRRFSEGEDADWDFNVTLDKGKLRIPSVTLDVKKDPPEKLAKVLLKLTSVPDVLVPILQIRQEESERVGKEVDPSRGIEFLRQHGLDRFAEAEEQRRRRLEAEVQRQKQAGADGEAGDFPQEPPREESDLTEDPEERDQTDDENQDEAAEQDGAGEHQESGEDEEAEQ
jgi:hypothetical protein